MLAKILALVCLLSTPAAAQEIAIRAGHLIDPATGTVAKSQLILVKDGVIVAVGPDGKIPQGAEVVDLSKAWVMPGLMDCHTHLTAGQSPGETSLSSYPNEGSGARALRGMRNAQAVLKAGFTTVRDVGNDGNYAAIDVRRAIEKGWFPGPTMLTTGKIIAPFGGQSSGVPPEQGAFWQFEYLDADTPDEIRKAVRRNIYYGANAIKLVAQNRTVPNSYYYSQEEIRAAVDEAHHAGITVAVHVSGGEAARNTILAGADSIEHGFDLSDELLTLMKEKGTVLVGTDIPEEHLKQMGFVKRLNFGGQMTLGERIVDRLRRAYRIGVKMAFGTDVLLNLSNKSRGEMAMDYLEVWLAAGIPPTQILKCMTTNAAELFQIQKHRGAVAVGLAADLIATPENPLENIRTLRQVQFVMKEGKIIKQTQSP